MNSVELAHPRPLELQLARASIRFASNVRLSELTYMRTGGIAETIVYPNSSSELARVLRILSTDGIPYKVIGSTSNLLFLDDARYRCLISTIDMVSIDYSEDHQELVADAGALLPDLSRRALLESVSGFEGLEGIPGTIGGAIFMNAGAYGSEIKDTLLEVEIAHEDGSLQTYAAAELGLEHRSSNLRRGLLKGVICTTRFRARRGDPRKIYALMELYHAKRHKYQDFMYPNLGSIFSGSPYRALGSRDMTFKIISSAYYLANYKIKFVRRESPLNRKWLNDVVVRRFGLKYDKQPFSDKTLNCLVNRGQGTNEMIRFIEQLKYLTAGKIALENEVVHGF